MYKRRILLFFLFINLSVFFSYHGIGANDKDAVLFDDTLKNVGIYLNDPAEVSRFSYIPDIIGWFDNWYGGVGKEKLYLAANNHLGTPVITWQPWGIDLESITAGEHDAYIFNYFQSLTAIAPNTDILIRFAHEMETRPKHPIAWYPWQGETDSEAYIAAWKHLVNISRMINPHIKWIWSPNKADEYAKPYYPGDDYVDYVGVTMNLRETADYYNYYKNFEDYYTAEGEKKYLEQYGKKIIICEVGFSSPDVAAKRRYIRSVFDYLLEDPMIAGVVFFNENVAEASKFDISHNDEYLEEFNIGLERVMELRRESRQ